MSIFLRDAHTATDGPKAQDALSVSQGEHDKQSGPAREVSTAVGASRPVPARRQARVLRVAGNILIAVGLMMLVGIGGWYGYTWWSNEQFKQQLVAEFGPQALEPQLQATPLPTTPPPAPLPNLNKSSIAAGMLGLAKGSQAPTDDTPPVRLVIPSVNIDSKIVPVTWNMIPAPGGGMKAEWQVADYAVGHHAGSANPGQRTGNVVLSGHVDYKGQVFKDLHKVNKGDEVIVYTERGQYLYVVTDIKLVLEEGASEEQKRANARFMDPTPDPTLTMITCWPYGIDTHRLIVIARPYQSTLSTQSEFTLR
jgi:sortase A